MPELLEHDRSDRSRAVPAAPRRPRAGERRARGDLRRQIAPLERELGELFATAFPRRGIDWRVGAVGGPRVLSTRRARAGPRRARGPPRATRRPSSPAGPTSRRRNRGLLERMIAEPERHRWVHVSNEDVGEPRLQALALAPALGHPRDAAGWWRVRLSSGCPLAEGPRPPAIAAKPESRWQEAPQAAPAPARRRPTPAPQAAPEAAPQPRSRRRPATDRRRAPAGAVGLVPAGRDRRPRRAGDAGRRLLRRRHAQHGAARHRARARLARRARALDPRALRGYRSHTVLLAGAAGVAVLALLFYAAPDLLPPVGRIVVGAGGRRRRRLPARARVPGASRAR